MFYAEIKELGDLPESEIGEVKLFDALPEKLTYPEIQPYLYNIVVKDIIRNMYLGKQVKVIMDWPLGSKH